MLWKRKPGEPTPDARDAQRRETVAQLRERILSGEELSPETLDATVRYIRENHDDFDGILTLARAAAHTLDVNFGDPDTQRERIVHEALSSQRDPERLDWLTRALLHDALRSNDMPGVLVRYMATHPERHPWEKTLRDFIVKDLPRSNIENPFPGLKRVFGAVKEFPALHRAMGAYARVFDPSAFRSDSRAFAEQLREDYPDDLPSATALLAMVASKMDTGWQPGEVYSAFIRLHDKFGDAVVDEVIRACDSFQIPLPSVLALGMVEMETPDAEKIIRRVGNWVSGLQVDGSESRARMYRSGLNFLKQFGFHPVGAAAYMSFAVETPDAGLRTQLLSILSNEATSISDRASPSIAAGIVDMYRRGLLDPQSTWDMDTQFLLAMTLLEKGAAFFVDRNVFNSFGSLTPPPNGSRPLLEYLTTTPLGANGQYDSEASERLIREILGRTEWIDAILSDFDRARTIHEGERIVNGWLLPALAAYPSHAPHAVGQLKQRLKNAKSLDDQVIVVCAFGHLCHRLHERALDDVWVLPRRMALERRLRTLRPAILGRAQHILHALDAQLGDIHTTQTMSPDAFKSLAEMRDAVSRAVASMAFSAMNDLRDRFTPASVVADVLRAPTGALQDHALQRTFAERAARQIAERLCS